MSVESPEYVQFPVPADRIHDVAEYLYGNGEAKPQAEGAPPAPPKPTVPMSDEQRRELLTRVYMESEPTFRRLVMLLAERAHPETPMSFIDASAAMGWTKPRSLPGALGAYGRRAKHRYGGFWPFTRSRDVATWSYYLEMSPDDAAFLRDLHAKSQKPTA